MNKIEILEKLNKIFIDIFDDDSIVLTDSTNADDIDEWDSLNQIKIILSCEDVFGIPLNSRKISTLNSIGEMVDYVHDSMAEAG